MWVIEDPAVIYVGECFLNFLKSVSFMCGHWKLCSIRLVARLWLVPQKFPQMCETWKNLLVLQMDSMNVLEHNFDTQPHSLHVFFNLHFLLIKYSEDQS